MAAISHLRAQEHPPKPPPSDSWLTKFLKKSQALHTIRQKLHERTRFESHDIDTVERWFVGLRELMDEKKIKKASHIWNFDESGVMVGNPTGEQVIVPIDIKEVHGPSPANRKSVTMIEAICADGRTPPASRDYFTCHSNLCALEKGNLQAVVPDMLAAYYSSFKEGHLQSIVPDASAAYYSSLYSFEGHLRPTVPHQLATCNSSLCSLERVTYSL